MAGFLSKLFGKGGGAEEKRGEGVSYKGCLIYAMPQKDAGGWRTAGVIVKEDSDPEQEHKFIRADVFASRDEAADCANRKARQIIDERGAGLFAEGEQPGHG